MDARLRMPLPRRRFLVKPGFPCRLTAYPILFLAVVLTAAGHYLSHHLEGALGLHSPSPHTPVQSAWQVVAPALRRVAVWGPAGFLAALAAWVWRWHVSLRSDLDRLTDWLETLGRGSRAGGLPDLKDKDVAALGASLVRAAAAFDSWEEAVESRCRALSSAAAAAAAAPADGDHTLREVREALEDLRSSWRVAECDEDLR